MTAATAITIPLMKFKPSRYGMIASIHFGIFEISFNGQHHQRPTQACRVSPAALLVVWWMLSLGFPD
jgi:hypothetical protein